MTAPSARPPSELSVSTAPPLLVAHGVTKRYGGTLALDSADLEVRPGEIHGLLGENGSGKSTLIKVLAGVVDPDEGELSLFGEPVGLPLRPEEVHWRGLRFVHQSLALIPSMSIGENLLIDRFVVRQRSGYVNWSRLYRDADQLLQRYGMHLDTRRPLGELAPIDRSLVAIVRAIAAGATPGETVEPRLLVLDEPTVFLPRTEVTRLFGLLRGLVEGGAGVLFVSHRMDEVRDHTDRVTVLRDGRNAGTRVTGETDHDQLVQLIVGRHLAAVAARTHTPTVAGSDQAVAVRGFHSKSLRDIDVTLDRGEILGLTGLAGSGYEEVLYALFGTHPQARGQLAVNGKQVDLRNFTPRDSIAAGFALIPADRFRDGLSSSATLEENVTLNVVTSFYKGLFLRRGQLKRRAGELSREFRIRPADPMLQMDGFSGGNQQKALLAKWLVGAPKVLLLHEPTQGVDVGARADIFAILRELAAAGTSILVASAEYEQIADLCTRVAIVADGQLSCVLSGPDMTTDRILQEALRGMSSQQLLSEGEVLDGDH